MAVELFKTTLSLGQDGNTAPADVDLFRDTLKDISDPGNVIDVQPMVNDANALTEVKAGTINFAYGSATSGLGGSVADHLTFTHEGGMTLLDMLAWWYEGGGETLFNGILTAAEGIRQFPITMRNSESGGWFKEAITLDKMLQGKYDSGEDIKYRAFGTHASAIDAIFPNVDTPPTTAGLTELQDLFTKVFTAGEFNEPIGDASTTGGLFPNYPSAEGSIIEALGGKPHYYIRSYHSPFRARVLWVNEAFWAGLSAADQRRIETAARSNLIRNMAHSSQGADPIIKNWQDNGVTVHRQLPPDLENRLLEAMEARQNEIAATDANYATILNSQRAFLAANGVRGTGPLDLRARVERSAYESLLKPNSTY